MTSDEFQRDNPPLNPETDAVVCEDCGQLLVVGEWPFCPHGFGVNVVRPDDIPGGQWQENGLPEPRIFYSKKERERALAETGHMICDWNRGDHDKVCPRWDAVDLESAEALVRRHQRAYKDDVPAAPPALIKALKDRLYT